MAGMEVDDGPARVGGKRHFSTAPHRIPQVCKYWQEGRCNKGDACQWLHSTMVAGTSGRFDTSSLGVKRQINSILEERLSTDQGGGGGRNQRKWGRPRPPVRRTGGGGGRGGFADGGGGGGGGRPQRQTTCVFWLEGECNRGSQCNFLHSYSATPEIEMMTQLVGHSQAVRAIAATVESASMVTTLYTGGQDQVVRVWNGKTGQCTNVVHMGGEVGSLLIEYDWLFVGLPNQVRACHMQTSKLQDLDGPKGQVYALAVYGDTMFAGSSDGTIFAWKFNTALSAFQPAFVLSGHTGAVVTLQAAGGRLYSGSFDHHIRVWDLASQQCLFTLEGHTNVVMSLLCWEQFLLSCSLDGYIKVWAATPGGGLEVAYTYPEERTGKLEGALALCGTVDGEGKPVLVCSYNDNTVRLYDLPTFNERGVLSTKTEVRVLQTAAGGFLFSGESSGDVKVWYWSKKAS